MIIEMNLPKIRVTNGAMGVFQKLNKQVELAVQGLGICYRLTHHCQ